MHALPVASGASKSPRKRGAPDGTAVATQFPLVGEEIWPTGTSVVKRAYLKGEQKEESDRRLALEGKRQALKKEIVRLWTSESSRKVEDFTPTLNFTTFASTLEKLLGVEGQIIDLDHPDPREFRKKLKGLTYIRAAEQAPWEELKKSRQIKGAAAREEKKKKEREPKTPKRQREPSASPTEPEPKRGGQEFAEKVREQRVEAPPPHPYFPGFARGPPPSGAPCFTLPFGYLPFVPTPQPQIDRQVRFTQFLAGPSTAGLPQEPTTRRQRVKRLARVVGPPKVLILPPAQKAPPGPANSPKPAQESPRSPSASPPVIASASPTVRSAGASEGVDLVERHGGGTSPLPAGSLLADLPVAGDWE